MVGNDVRQALEELVETAPDKAATLNEIRRYLHELSPCRAAPADCVLLVPLEQVEPNTYNPNSVARIEMGLLLKSIEHDGYTQPVVTVHDPERHKYVIVDGFHRYYVMKTNDAIREQ